MRNNPDSFSPMQKSATSNEVADSLRGNHDSSSLDQPNSREKEKTNQRKNQEKKTKDFDSELKKEIENIDQECDAILDETMFVNENNLKSFIDTHYSGNTDANNIAEKYLREQKVLGIEVNESELRMKIDSETIENKELSTADRVREYTESIRDGKSSESILKSLIAKFGNNPDVGTWVENWQNFLRLHELAKTKSPKERKAIQSIITRADYTTENSFRLALSAIRSSSELSEATKLEIFTEFDGSSVSTVSEMDSGLNLLRTRKKSAKELLNTKTEQLDSLDSDIDSLKKELEEFSESDPKREELEQELSEKMRLLKQTKVQVELLELESNKETAFELRKGFFVNLNSDDSRSIKNPENFALKMPSNILPFTGTKNLRSVNLAFVCSPLKQLGILNDVFSPNLDSGEVPSKSHRDTGHLILESLGVSDKQILSEKDISTMNRDLSRIMDSGVLSPRQHLVELGLYDILDQSFNMERFKRVLKFARENRQMKQDRFSKALKSALNGSKD